MRWLFSLRTATTLGLLLMLGVIGLWVRPATSSLGLSQEDLDALPQALAVRRTLSGSITALGYVKPVQATEIECELQRLRVYIRGEDPTGSGAATILWLIPNGSEVEEGDLLAELDSSEYEELVRIQEISTTRAESDYRAAQLEVEVAKIALKEFDEGVKIQTMQNQEAQLTLTQSELERAKNRLEWSQRMINKGYISNGQLIRDQEQRQRSEISLGMAEITQEIYQEYTVPKMRQELLNQLRAAESRAAELESRYGRYRDRLELLQGQIQLCKIRAPHSGLVVYANQDRREPEIEVGNSVRQGQELFYIPDMSEMKIEGMIHETFIRRVAPGMMAKVRIPALQGLEVDAVVESVAQFPMPKQTWSDSGEIKNYQADVRLLDVPKDLMPGMTANLEILSAPTRQAITVPVEAVSVDDHAYYCHVITPQGLELRQVALGEADDPSWLEIARGIAPGERVILDPNSVIDADVEPTAVVMLDTTSTEDPQDEPTVLAVGPKSVGGSTAMLEVSTDSKPSGRAERRPSRSDKEVSAAS